MISLFSFYASLIFAAESAKLEQIIKANLERLGYGE
jgi:hypothetical protein